MIAKSWISFITLILMVTVAQAQAQQSSPPRQGVYAELGGSAISFVSINYDRFLSNNWTGRTGLGFSFDFSRDDLSSDILGRDIKNKDYLISLPLTLSRLFGKEKKFFEISPGASLLFVSEKKNVTDRSNRFLVIPSLYAGYRRQPANGGFLFRVGLTAAYFEHEIFPELGLSFGYAFKRSAH